MKKAFIKGALAITAMMFIIVSCKKKEVDKDTQSSVDFSLAESGYSGVLPAVNQIGIDEEGVNKANTCATVTIESGDTATFPANPVTLRIDYGTSGCVDYDGRLKQGILFVTFHDVFTNQGAQVDITFDNFFVNAIRYEGSMTLIHNGNYSYTQTVTNGQCTASDWEILYDGTSTYDWVGGLGTPEDPTDDEFHYTNNSTCTNRRGENFTVTTDAPIVKRNSCKWIQSGVLNVAPDGKAVRTFDFGNNTCDEFATVTINGNTFEFEMQ